MESLHLFQCLSFFSWAALTYTSHFYAKQYLSSSHASQTRDRVIFLTTVQLGCGSILYLILKMRKKAAGVSVLDYRVVLLGGCHSYGMLMTNSSMAYTTASLTHLVKMTEPFFTTIIMVIMGRLQLSCKIIVIMILILLTAVGSEPITDANSSLVGLLFALISNLCYAMRNTGTKYLFPEESSKSVTTLDGFAALSVGGLLSLIPAWIFSCSLGHHNYSSLLSDNNFFIFISSISHALYNIISLTIILLFFNPVQHALLNVGKRTSLVLVFYIFSQRFFAPLNFLSAVLCLIISLASVQSLSVKKQDGAPNKTEDASKCPNLLLSGLSILILSISLSILSWVVTRHHPHKAIWQDKHSTARENWLECIDDIQESIMSKLSDVLNSPENLSNPTPLLLIDPAYGGNVGDNLIAYGEVVLMERMGYLNHTECNIGQSQGLSVDCDNFTHVPDGGLAWWHGGGNWGDLWSRDDLTLRRMRSFIQLAKKGKTVIGMPQSFHYLNKMYETQDADEWMEAVAAEYEEEQSRTRMILTWRQQDSYERASTLYPLVDNRLVPDAAFMIGPLKESFSWSLGHSQVDILFLLRNDKESLHTETRNIDKLRQILDSQQETMGLSFHLVDWWDRGRFFNQTSDQQGPEFKFKVRKF